MKEQIHTIIFGTETPGGQRYDLALMVVILLSVGVVTLDSIDSVRAKYELYLDAAEWFFTVLFTIEYLVRLWVHPRPAQFARSFYGVVDLISFLPTYVAVFFPGASFIVVVRLLRVLRIFRVLRLLEYLGEADLLIRSLAQSRRKIFVFMFTVFVVTVIFGSLMYIVEGPEYGFDSIPRSVYWAVVTVTTVGYGDIAPQTTGGQLIATLAMLTGYAIIAVPTGIITAEFVAEQRAENYQRLRRACTHCSRSGHEEDAMFCKYCGADLPE